MAGCKKSRGKSSPKMKSNRAAMKRFKVTASGLVVHAAKGKRHCLSNKSRKRKRQLNKARSLVNGDMKLVARMILK